MFFSALTKTYELNIKLLLKDEKHRLKCEFFKLCGKRPAFGGYVIDGSCQINNDSKQLLIKR